VATQPLNFSDPAKATKAQLPYPSSRPPTKQKAPTDWDKLEQELKEEEKDEKLEGAPRPARHVVVVDVVCAGAARWSWEPGAHHAGSLRLERCMVWDAGHGALSVVRCVVSGLS